MPSNYIPSEPQPESAAPARPSQKVPWWRMVFGDYAKEIVQEKTQPIYGKGLHPVLREVAWSLGQQEEGADEYIKGRIGYLPSYWEDPKRVGKWYHKLQALPEGSSAPSWIDKDKLDAAYKYFEQRNEGTPWWDWRFLHPSDSARRFLQGFDNPPPEAMYPDELLYTPGAVAEQPLAGPPLPGSPEWKNLDLWQKLQISIFGQGPSILDPYPESQGGALRSGLASFGRGFASGAPTGAAIGFFGSGFNPVGAAFGGLITGLVGGFSTVGLETIQKRRAEDMSVGADPALEWMLNNMLALIQAPAEIVERGVGVGSQIAASMADPERYGPVSEVFGNLKLEIAIDPRDVVQSQAWLIPYPGGPTGQAASLAWEQQVGVQKVITHGLEYLSTALSSLISEPLGLKKEELQLSEVDEVWDLGGTEPRKIGDNTPDTAVGIFLWAQTAGRRELMTTEAAPRDVVLAIGQRFGISGILSDLLLQAMLDPLNFAPKAEIKLARGVAEGKGIGGLIGRKFGVGEIERSYLAQAVAMIDAETGRARDIRGVRDLAGWIRGNFQKGGVEVIRTFANILRTGDDAFRIQKISGMSSIARWLGGVTPEGKLKIAIEPTGVFGKLFGLTPKSRATKFMFTSNDVIKAILQMGETPVEIIRNFDAMAKGDAQQWQALGLGMLGTPDGHYPVLAARDFRVEKLRGFMEIWRNYEKPRQMLAAVQEMFGHEDVRQTVRMLRDYGDAAWTKLGDAIRQGVGEGDETAGQLAGLIEQRVLTKEMLDGAVKGSLSGAVPLTVDHFRWMVYDAWLTHVQEWVIKAFNVKIENSLYRLSNALKQGASIMLLDGNPGYLYANFWNNVSTAWIDGNLGFNRLEHIVGYFEETLGLTPSRLEQAFGGPAGVIGEAGLVPRNEIAGMKLDEAIAKGVTELEWIKAREARAFQTLTEKTTGQGAIKMLDRALGRLRQKAGATGAGKYSPLIMSRVSAAVERFQGANAFYKGTKSWLNRAWRRGIGFEKMPQGIEMALGSRLAEKIYGAVEGNLKYDRIEAMLLGDGRIEASPQQFVEGVAEALGNRESAADIVAMLDDADILPVLEAELPKARTPGDLHVIFSEVENKIREHINKLHSLDIIEKAREVGEAIKIGDLTGLHDTWVDLNARMSEWWTSHVIEWGNVVEEADLLTGEGLDAAADALYRARLETAKAEANRIMEMQTAVVDGLVEGLRESGVDVGPKYALGLRTQIAEWKGFFEIKDVLWEDYGRARADGTLEAGRYVEIIDELQGRYQLRIEDDLDLQQVMDAELVQATARINLRAATVLNGLFETIREHKAKMYVEEAAVRTAGHELWNLTTGVEAANILMRNFAGHPTLLKAFEQTIKRWKLRQTDVTTKDLRSFRRQVYDVWSKDVKVEHIKDYYLLRSDGMLEVMSEDVRARPPDAELPEPIRVTTESMGTEAEAARITELIDGGIEPTEAARMAAEQAAGEVLGIDYSKDVTVEEIRTLARDAGIGTATRDGRPFDGHLLNVLNKDLGLNDTPMKLRNLDDLVNLRREGGAEGDALLAARQALVNRGVKRLRWKQESQVVNLSLEALETLDGGIDNVGTKKLRRIAEANGLSEVNLMPKEHIWSWMDARRNRLRPVPFENATPEAIKQQVRAAMDRAGYPGTEVSDAVVSIFEARARAVGMTIREFLEFRAGISADEILYTFQQKTDALIPVYRSTDFGMEPGQWGSINLERTRTRAGAHRAAGPTGLIEMTYVTPEQWKAGMDAARADNARRGTRGQDLSEGYFPDLDLDWGPQEDVLPPEAGGSVLYQESQGELSRPFFSHMTRVIEAKMSERMPVGEFFNFLKKQGVKADELKWSGIEQYMKDTFIGDAEVVEKSTVLAVARDLTPSIKEVSYPIEPVPLAKSVTSWRTDTPGAVVPGVGPLAPVRPRASWAQGFDSRVVDVGSSGFVDRPGSSANYRLFEFTGGPAVGGEFRLRAQDPGGLPVAPYSDLMGAGRFLLEVLTSDDVRAIPLPGQERAAGMGLQLFETLDDAKAYAEGLAFETTEQPARWASVTYPGGTNYRELVMHLPKRSVSVDGLLAKINDVFVEEVTVRPSDLLAVTDVPTDGLGLEILRRNYATDEFPGVKQAVAELDAYARTLGYDDSVRINTQRVSLGNADYQSPHWSEPNVISHIRLKDRFTADGRKLLFVEELQSDWGQTWRDNRGQLRSIDEDAVRAVVDVPPMPWEKTWPEMSLRRVMRLAAEEGYDGIAWNTGEGMFRTETGQFPEGAGLNFESIELRQGSELTPLEDAYDLTIVRAGETVPEVSRGLSRSQVEEMLGHDVLLQIENNARGYERLDDGGQIFRLGRGDITEGRWSRMYEGFKTFYDQILPSLMKKEVKKWGASVESAEFGHGELATQRRVEGVPADADALPEGGYSPGHVVYITEAMRQGSLYEGFKLFQQGNEGKIRVEELAARQKLAAAIRQEGLGAATLSRLIEGEDIRSVFANREQIPKPVFDAYEAWRPTQQDAQWLRSQPRMFQGPKGSVDIGKDGRAIMRFMKSADPSTALHEPAHIFRLDLLPTELDVVTDWLKNTVREWDGTDLRGVDVFEGKFTGDEGVPRAAEEAFARGFERYIAEGIAPTEGLRAVFEKFKQWLLEIYRSIKGSGIDIPLSEAMRSLYADMLGGRAPDFDVYNTTWQSIGSDAVIRGQPEVAASAVVPAPVEARPTGQTGATTTAHGADPNVSYDFVYRIVDINDITPSHTLEGNLSKGYPKKLQPRDRSRAASVRQSEQMAAELNPVILLEPNARIDEGAPIIGPDGLVESGSGRVNALRLAMRDFPEGYAAYKQLLLDQVRNGTYGEQIDASAISENPVLVRERLTDMDRFEFARLANESAILGTSMAEQASIDVGKISDSMLQKLVISEAQTVQDALKMAANQEVVNEFVRKSPRSEYASLMTRDGQITRQGMDRILAAIFMYVYGEGTEGLRLAENVFESADPIIRNVTNGMMAAAGDMAKAEGLIRAGRRPEGLSLIADFSTAVETLTGLKRRGISMVDFIEQKPFEAMGVGLSEFQQTILVDLEAAKRSAKAIRELLQTYARMVIQEPDVGQMGLLGAYEYPSAQEMWMRAKEAPAQTGELFQMPEQYPMRGFYDQTPGIQESGAKSAEGFRNMLGIMDELREQMAGPEGYLQEIRSDDVRGRLSSDQQAEFKRWTKDLKSQLSGTKFSGVKWGEDARNFSLLDYTAIRGIDTTFLGIPFNYAFWPTRTIMRWLLRFGEYPALLANYARLNEARRKQEERPGFPRRLQGKMPLPIPWKQEWMGDALWVDPIRQFFPPHMFLDNLDRIATETNRMEKRTVYILQKWVENGETQPGDAQEAIQTRDGPLWQMALDQAKSEMEQEFKDPLDYMSLVSGLALPISIGREFARGTPERISPLPLTRYTKTATSMFAQMTGIGDPEGINLEGPIREALDLPSYDRFEDYRVDRMLASMMTEDPSIVREALIAGQEKEGPLWDEAVRRVNSARNYGIYANPAFWIFGLGGDTFPVGEVRQRKLSEEFGLAITAREIGDSTAINRFFEKYPEYEGRLASFDSQEERMRFFLVDEVWTKYRELGSANKELVRKQLGQEFQEMFLSKETRSYNDIPLEYLASWANLLGGYVPKNAENRIEYKDAEPPLQQLPPKYAKVIDDFRRERNQKFPNWFAVQQGYFASGPQKSQAREDYLVRWPEQEEYWDWRDAKMEGNEFLSAYYERYDLEGSEGSIGSLGVADILTNPMLVRQLMADRYGGQSLTTGALEELRRIYNLLQQPGGDFQAWVDGLEFEQGMETQGQRGPGDLGLP